MEIERKYLIRMPDIGMLDGLCAEKWDITQTYLLAAAGATERVRRIRDGAGERYFHTVKRRISALSCAEDEEEITREAYEAFLLRRDSERRAIEKTRWRIPYEAHLMEIDAYPFWENAAVLEIELTGEDDAASYPDWVEVLADVTADLRFKNVSLAKQLPDIQEYLKG